MKSALQLTKLPHRAAEPQPGETACHTKKSSQRAKKYESDLPDPAAIFVKRYQPVLADLENAAEL
jgi:hypothetical protein